MNLCKRLLSRGNTNKNLALSDALDASKETSGLNVRNDSEGQEITSNPEDANRRHAKRTDK